ncbi:FlaD/FlaE family flagellar protein [Halorubrum sp. DTA98]|uniref:FlaD/FlaE family flagellar protein n=1 Tax=Halorubrum sp. DTA98 TaxID=3402163 RepID=UPI003AAAAB0C
MTLDPRRYDVRELRSIAGTRRPAADGAPRSRTAREPSRTRTEQAVRSAAFTELLQRQRGLREVTDGERPYLSAVPASPGAEHEIGEWLGYLVDVGGHVRSRDALSYYTEIGWIAPAVADAFERRLHGFETPRHDRPFTPADHRISLVSLVRLASYVSDDHERR